MKTKVVMFLEDFGSHKKGQFITCEMKSAGMLSEQKIVKIIKNKKCYVCESENISSVFIKKNGVKHFYCESCDKKYIVKNIKRGGKR